MNYKHRYFITNKETINIMTWLTGWNRRKQITVSGSTAGAQSDYQMKLTVNQGSGTDSTGILYLGGNVLTTFNDVRFTKSDGTTLLYYWIESITGSSPTQAATVWIKLAPSPDTIPVSPGTYNFYIYYDNFSAPTGSSGTDTFIQHMGISAAFLATTIALPSNYIYEGLVRPANTASRLLFSGVADSLNWGPPNGIFIGVYDYGPYNMIGNIRAGTSSLTNTTPIESKTVYYRYKIIRTPSIVNFYIDNVLVVSESNNIPTANMGLALSNYRGTPDQKFSFIRNYTSPEPTFSTTGAEEIDTTVAAGGGIVTVSGGYRIHTFTSSGTFTVNKSMSIEVLVVAGGGAGGCGNGGGGGGGAGGIVYKAVHVITISSYSVTVGTGGTPRTTGISDNGGNSVFDSITAIGGGGGPACTGGPIVGSNGGCGSGGNATGGGGTATQENSGGGTGYGHNGGSSDYTTHAYGGGGGGGAGAVGANGTSSAGGIGGIGTAFAISGSSIFYAGGGGGGSNSASVSYPPGLGGNGGGGAGGAAVVGITGTPNTGGGGGGGGAGSRLGGNGGSGIVIIRYQSAIDITATSMTITPRETPCRTGICIIDVSVTWTNNAGTTSSFVPSITVSSGTASVYSSQNLGAGASVTLPFTVSGMTAGTCSICPNPN
jgi:hypothetical protein